jgi:hypothetical protein
MSNSPSVRTIGGAAGLCGLRLGDSVGDERRSPGRPGEARPPPGRGQPGMQTLAEVPHSYIRIFEYCTSSYSYQHSFSSTPSRPLHPPISSCLYPLPAEYSPLPRLPSDAHRACLARLLNLVLNFHPTVESSTKDKRIQIYPRGNSLILLMRWALRVPYMTCHLSFLASSLKHAADRPSNSISRWRHHLVPPRRR